MGRGQRTRGYEPDERQESLQAGDASAGPGWSKAELVEVSGLSPKTFDTIRKAARVSGPSHGGLKHIFDAQDLIALIQKAESGKFDRIGKPAAEGWRRLLTEAGLVMPAVISRARR